METIINSSDYSEELIKLEEPEETVAHFIPLELWAFIFSIITIVGVIGNFTVIWIVLAHKRMRTVTNLFLVNLAIADGFIALFNIPFTSYEIIWAEWPFGVAYCKINEAIGTLSICVSVLTLSVIAIDRFMAIIFPFKRRFNKTKTILTIAVIWLVSLVASAPNWIYLTVEFDRLSSDGSIIERCLQMWPNNDLEQAYNIFFIILTYVLPLSVMGYTYTRIGITLWGSKPVGEQNENQIKQELAKKKIVKMMIIVVLIFTICWLPTCLYFALAFGEFFTNLDWNWDEIYVAAFFLAMSNSMLNPIIYCWMNGRFRAGFKKAFKWLPFIKYNPAECEKLFSNVTVVKTIGD